MNKIINKNFHDICKKDVDEILNKTRNLLPYFIEDWAINKSYYNDEEKLIICTPVIDEYGDKIGQGINIVDHIKNESYRIEYIEEEDYISFELENQYKDSDEKLIVKRMAVILEDTAITRSFYYENGNKSSYYDVGYELGVSGEYQEYLKTESLEETLESIRPSKIRKRN